MALQASGSISFSQIANEFGTPPGKNFGAYRISQTVGSLNNLPLDADVPQPGQQIKFSNFYSKRLNVVVDFFSILDNTTRRNAKDSYDSNNVVVIGGFRSKPSSSSGRRVIIHVNKQIGSNKNNRINVALKTGDWDPDTILETRIGPNGKILGAGGNGGNGGTGAGAGTNGTQGTSAFGIQYSTTVVNQGIIFGGRGGGGGGGGSEYRRCARNQRGCDGGTRISLTGGGGAGGRGLPAGTGGSGGNNGTSGTSDVDGTFGSGIFGAGTSAGYDGTSGNGGNIEQSGQSGTTENNRGSSGVGGSGGQRGYAIIVASGANLISYSGGGTLGGDTITGTTPG